MSEYITEFFGSSSGGSYTERREEIVRCRDCESWAGPCCEEHELGVCNLWISSSGPMLVVTEPNGFCAWGERTSE